MLKTETLKWKTRLLVATAALAGSALAVAGPFCANGQRGAGPMMYPHSAMGPYPYKGMSGPQSYPHARAPGYGAMGAPVDRRMSMQHRYPGSYASPALPAQARAVDKPAEEATGDNVTVRIDGMRFEPAEIRIKPGTTVTWIHNGNMPHTVTGKTGGMRSSTLYGGQQFSHTFNDTGSYAYICELHPSMKGQVVVEGSGQET